MRGRARLGQNDVNGAANGGTDIGLSLMAVMSIAGVHSSLSPSLATYQSFFSRTPQERAIADRTLWISLGASTLTAFGILLVFKRWTPAIIGEVAALGLFALGMHAVHSEPPTVSTMEQKRIEQVSEQAQPAIGARAGTFPTEPLRLQRVG